jgi:hypothetical protein
MSAPSSTGVFSYKPPTDAFNGVEELTLAANLAAYLEIEKNKEIDTEVSGVSKETKKFLDSFKP